MRSVKGVSQCAIGGCLPRTPRFASGGARALAAVVYGALATALVVAVRSGNHLSAGRVGLLAVGLLGAWRLSWFLVNATRAGLHVHWRFPRLRHAADALGPAGRASELFVLVTSYRIEPEVTAAVFEALFAEAAAYGASTTVMASVADAAEQDLVREVFRRAGTPASVELVLFEQRGHGKRQAMAEVLDAIRDRNPSPTAVVAFMDGDTLLAPGTFARSLSFFALRPDLGALTTDERAIATGSSLAREWFDLRFAQRHLFMSSVGLSGRVLTLTGRFCAFRAPIAVQPDFIEMVRNDVLDHWRLGRIRFLTGDDKSTWFWVLRAGWSMFYLPDVRVHTFETLPARGFLAPTIRLMARWYGNMLRNNGRALALGPRRVGWFTWWSLLEQRISMWTALTGPAFALLVLAGKRPGLLAAYLLWTMLVKTAQSLFVGLPRGRVSPFFPFLLYYSQVVGALVKIHMSFRLDGQRWTRQNTGPTEAPRRPVTATALNLLAYALFFLAVDRLSPTLATRGGARTQAELERLLARAERGAVVSIAPGILRLTHPLVIRRDDVVLAGAGAGRTTLLGSFAGQGPEPSALVIVRGELPGEVGGRARLASVVAAGATALPLGRDLGVRAGDFVALRAANDRAFLDAIGARGWDQPYPHLRQTLVRVSSVRGTVLALERPIDDPFPAGTEVVPVRLRQGVVIRDLTLRYDLGGRPSPSLYLDTRPRHAVDGLAIVGAAGVTVQGVEVLFAGRHPLSLDTVYAPRVIDVRLEGAWNKGPGGNGYLRIARTYHGAFAGLTLRGLRHLAFQWSSHDNTVTGLDADCDVNFHGGFSRRNQVEALRLAPRPGHPWAAVTRTPGDARWAPPDGSGNVVVEAGRPLASAERR